MLTMITFEGINVYGVHIVGQSYESYALPLRRKMGSRDGSILWNRQSLAYELAGRAADLIFGPGGPKAISSCAQYNQ